MGAVSYRCVCGETLSLDAVEGGQCGACGRHYTAAVFEDAIAQTVSLTDVDAEATLPAATAKRDRESRQEQRFGHFLIESKLGHGGVGSVYRALDESLQRYVALKVIDRHVTAVSDTKHLQRLFQEALAQARVNHPHVAHIYFVGREGAAPFLAMELVGRRTLADRLREGPLPYADVIEYALQLADALDHCLAYDIVHGDIKPSNVLLGDNGLAKLSDFGLARRMSETSEPGGGLSGTPDYLAPEVIRGATTDLRSDLYALGVTLFEMTFGRLPYTYRDHRIAARLEAHQSSPIEFPEPWPDAVPPAWREVLGRLLAKDPEQRHQSYPDLIADLQRLRPVKLPRAARIPRMLAWLVDAALIAIVFRLGVVLVGELGIVPRFDDNLLFGVALSFAGGVLTAVAASLPLLLGSAVQSYWGTTPGKTMFQIRIVQRHGLRPDRATLAIRLAIQMLPVWGRAVYLVADALQLSPLGAIIFGVACLIWLADVGAALLRRDGLSLHDRLFGTRVVLDVAPRESKLGFKTTAKG